jgi:hypothetical protein
MSEKLLLANLLAELERAQVLSRRFQDILTGSQALSWDAPEGYVWQGSWVGFWERLSAIELNLLEIGEALQRLRPDLESDVDACTDPPIDARITTAIEDPQFIARAYLEGEEDMAYSVNRIKKWHEAYVWWLATSLEKVSRLSDPS